MFIKIQHFGIDCLVHAYPEFAYILSGKIKWVDKISVWISVMVHAQPDNTKNCGANELRMNKQMITATKLCTT